MAEKLTYVQLLRSYENVSEYEYIYIHGKMRLFAIQSQLHKQCEFQTFAYIVLVF